MMRALLLDWGGVLCVDPSQGFACWCGEKLGVKPQILAKVMNPHMEDFQRGLAENLFWQRVCADLKIIPPDFLLWEEALAAVYQEHAPIFELARNWKKCGGKVGLLSNTEKPAKKFHLSRQYDFFDVRVFSCDENLIKPQAEIYWLAARRLQCPPEEILLLDDREVNIKGALAAKMPALLYDGSAQCDKRAWEKLIGGE